MIDPHDREKQQRDHYEHVVGVVAMGDWLPWVAIEYMKGVTWSSCWRRIPTGYRLGRRSGTGSAFVRVWKLPTH